MSAPAIKSSMPGVGTPSASTGHTMLPMNMVAQKVVPSNDQSSGGMKPLQGSNLNYVTLQPSNQPLSLIQEHRAPTYQAPFANNIPSEQQQQIHQHKELEQLQDPSKLIQNGTEQTKVETEKKDGFTSSTSSLPMAPVVTNTTPTLTTTASTSTPTPAQTLTPTIPTLASTPTAVPTVPSSLAAVAASNANTIAPVNTLTTDPVATNNTTLSLVPAVGIIPLVTSAASAGISATEQPTKVNNVDGSSQEQQSETVQKSKDDSIQSKSDQGAALSLIPSQVEEKKTVSSSSKEEVSPVILANTSPQKTTQSPLLTTKSEETPTKTEASIQKSPKVQMIKLIESPEKIEAKEVKTPVSTRPVKRKSRELKEPKSANSEGGPRSKRNRVQTTPYQSPLPEIAMIVKNLSKPSPRGTDDKLIVFYKNEFLAVRNTEGSFYVCQAMQNIYKSSKRIRIRWLSQDKNNGEIYSPDFYDHTDFDCILTNLNLNKVEKNKYQLTKYELLRTENILKRAIDVEAGVSEKPPVTEEHPDGLDLSLYKDEAQLKKRKRKEKNSKSSKSKRLRKKTNKNTDYSEDEDDNESEDDEDDESDESSSKSETSQNKSSLSPRKSSPAKKRSSSKTIITTPTVPKGPSRAERALNRSKGLVGPSTSGVASSSSVTLTKKVAEPKKATEPKKQPVKAAVASTSASTSGQSRAKARGNVAAPTITVTAQVTPTQETKAPGGRPKRVASAMPVASTSSEDNSSRKKSRGRA